MNQFIRTQKYQWSDGQTNDSNTT